MHKFNYKSDNFGKRALTLCLSNNLVVSGSNECEWTLLASLNSSIETIGSLYKNISFSRSDSYENDLGPA
jgi:hypothetical protein